MQNSIVFRDGSLQLVGNTRFVRIQSIGVVSLLIVDVHFNIGKNWLQNVVYMSNERNWSVLLSRVFLIRFYLFFVLPFYFFAILSFVTTNRDRFQFQRQVRLYPVFIEWGSRIEFLFTGQQDIVNYWDFPSKFSRNCRRSLLPKITRHD